MSMARNILKKAFKKDSSADINSLSDVSAWKIAMNGAMPLYFGVDTYKEAREEGHGIISSAIQAGADTAAGFFLPWYLYLGAQVTAGMGEFAVDTYSNMKQYARQVHKQRRNIPFSNATFVDSQQTYTMRQAGMNLARKGQYAAAQTTLGNEAASVMHMGR